MQGQSSAQLALALMHEMAATQLPNTGNYLSMPDGSPQLKNADLMSLFMSYPYGNFLMVPAWTAEDTPGNATMMPHPSATAAEMLGMEYMMSVGMYDFTALDAAVAANPTLTLNDLYVQGDLLNDAVQAAQIGPNGWNNDPVNLFDVNWS